MTRRNSCKVDATIEQYDLTVPGTDGRTVDDHLLARWTGRDGHATMGYRSLTEWFNKRLLKQVYDAHGRAAIASRIDSEYEALTGDDELARQELIQALEADDIDARAVVADFVSWSTMRHHLKGCLEGEKERPVGDVDWERESVEAIRESALSRMAKVVRSLASKGKVPRAGEARLTVDFQLACPDCPTRISVEQALEQGYVCQTHHPEPESLISS